MGVGTLDEVLACANSCQTRVVAQVLELLAQVLEWICPDISGHVQAVSWYMDMSGYPDIRISGYPDIQISGYPDIHVNMDISGHSTCMLGPNTAQA